MAEHTHTTRVVGCLRCDNDRLRAALVAARGELEKWGWGDHHYGEAWQERRVVDAIEDINRALNPPPQMGS
jgi:hypothetical protein